MKDKFTILGSDLYETNLRILVHISIFKKMVALNPQFSLQFSAADTQVFREK